MITYRGYIQAIAMGAVLNNRNECQFTGRTPYGAGPGWVRPFYNRQLQRDVCWLAFQLISGSQLLSTSGNDTRQASAQNRKTILHRLNPKMECSDNRESDTTHRQIAVICKHNPQGDLARARAPKAAQVYS